MSKYSSYIKHLKRKRREDAIEDGYYDGRFANKIIKNKKKHNSKVKCRKFKKHEYDE